MGFIGGLHPSDPMDLLLTGTYSKRLALATYDELDVSGLGSVATTYGLGVTPALILMLPAFAGTA